MKDKIQIGQAILVPFGRQGLINAFCVGFSDYLPEEIRAKKINKILDENINNNFKFSRELYTIYLTYCFNNGLVKRRYYKEKKMDSDGQYLFWSRRFKFIFIPFPKDLKKIKKTIFDIIENKQVNEKELIYRAEVNLSNDRYIDKRMLDNCIYENGLIQEIYENWESQI